MRIHGFLKRIFATAGKGNSTNFAEKKSLSCGLSHISNKPFDFGADLNHDQDRNYTGTFSIVHRVSFKKTTRQGFF